MLTKQFSLTIQPPPGPAFTSVDPRAPSALPPEPPRETAFAASSHPAIRQQRPPTSPRRAALGPYSVVCSLHGQRSSRCSATSVQPLPKDESSGLASTHNVQALEEHVRHLQSQVNRLEIQDGPRNCTRPTKLRQLSSPTETPVIMQFTLAIVCQTPPSGVMMITVSKVLVLLPSLFALTLTTKPQSTTSPARVSTTTVPSDPLGSGGGLPSYIKIQDPLLESGSPRVFGMLLNRSRDIASSLDYNSDTGPVVQDRDHTDWYFRTPATWLVRGCSMLLMTCTHVQSRHDD